jgi:hypothetical protein
VDGLILLSGQMVKIAYRSRLTKTVGFKITVKEFDSLFSYCIVCMDRLFIYLDFALFREVMNYLSSKIFRTGGCPTGT